MKLILDIVRFVLVIATFGYCCTVKAQALKRNNTSKYTVNEGMLQSTMRNIGFDKNNFCWLSFPNGIQKFDGKKFIDIPIQEGLPDNKWVYFFRCANGDLIISHSMGLSKYDITNNKFSILYRTISKTTKPMIFIGEDKAVFYCYAEPGHIIGFSCNDYRKVKEIKLELPGYTASDPRYNPIISQNIINHTVGIHINYKLHLIDLEKEALKFDPVTIPQIYWFLLWLEDEEQVMYYQYDEKENLVLVNHNLRSGVKQLLTGKYEKGPITYRSRIYNWKGKTMVSYFNHLYETNAGHDSIRYELVDFQNKPIAGNAGIADIKEDNNGNLYLQTVNDGFRKIVHNTYPIKYYGTDKKEENYIISVFSDKKNNRLLAGTYGHGVFIFDTLQRLIKHIKAWPVEENRFSVNCIIKKPNGDYIFSAYGDKMWLLSNDLSSLKPLSIVTTDHSSKANIGYFANFICSNENTAVIKSQLNFYKINLKTNAISEYYSGNRSEMSGILFNGNIIVHSDDFLVVLDTITFKEIKRIPFKGTGAVRCFLKKDETRLFVGSNKGIYLLDSNFSVLMHVDKSNGLPDECIYAMTIDQNGNLWCSTNKGIFRLDENNNILQFTKEDGLQENEFNTASATTSEDGEIFFGGVNGVSSFFPGSIIKVEEKLDLFFTGVKVNNEDKFKDTAVWNIKEMNLNYDENSLAFDFIAMANNNPELYIYQYKMEGVDDQWTQNNALQTVHYFLSPGKYVFKIYASRVFNKDAVAMKEIHIYIKPPFWKTWWFYSLAGLIVISSLAYGINRYNKRKYQKKVQQLESEHKLQLERERISRDLHDNIGAYASTILYKTDLLQEEMLPDEKNELMNDLRFASKDIITSLRETIWALKKDQYEAQECLLRIRNFIQPFVKYYPNIRFSVTGEAPQSMTLIYTKALNLVRIVQEAVSNSIKHSNASEINIKSDIENNRWKFTVSDNGSGFNYNENDDMQEGNGLNNMRQRAAESGFDFIMESSSKGTIVRFFV